MPPVKQKIITIKRKIITIQCSTPDAEIRYEYSNYEGSEQCPEPTEESKLYKEPLTISNIANSTNYIKAKAFKAGMIASDTVGADVNF